jgi:GNAT superfamily N-acetyltransferase
VSEYYELRRISIRDLTAFFGFLAGWIGSAAFAWPHLVVGWETGHFTRGVFNFLVIAFGTGVICGVAGLGLGSLAGATWERRHRHRRAIQGEILDGAVPAAEAVTRSAPIAVGAKAAVPPDPSIRFATGGVDASAFLALAQRVWPRSYDTARTSDALAHTTNVGAWDGDRLVGTVRVLSDGYFFATIPEILVDPDYQRRGIGRELMRRALEAAPGGVLFLGAQPESVGFFERIGCVLGPTGFVLRRKK